MPLIGNRLAARTELPAYGDRDMAVAIVEQNGRVDSAVIRDSLSSTSAFPRLTAPGGKADIRCA
jgi:hypothetical protein